MKKITVILLFAWCLASPAKLIADECMEGDCDNGFGSGFTDANLIYEGEWKDGVPDGKGKLYKSKGQVIEGVWKKGELVKEKSLDDENKNPEAK